jgi:Domain of unknown function (DUF4386)
VGDTSVNLLSAVHLVTDPSYRAAFQPTQRNAQMMASLNAFSAGCAVAVVFFGIHLILIGYLTLMTSMTTWNLSKSLTTSMSSGRSAHGAFELAGARRS